MQAEFCDLCGGANGDVVAHLDISMNGTVTSLALCAVDVAPVAPPQLPVFTVPTSLPVSANTSPPIPEPPSTVQGA